MMWAVGDLADLVMAATPSAWAFAVHQHDIQLVLPVEFHCLLSVPCLSDHLHICLVFDDGSESCRTTAAWSSAIKIRMGGA